LDDVTTRCIPGCSGLSFCSNFNNRLTSFRTCTPSDDLAAKSDYTQWSSSNTILNPLVNIHIKPISECLPDHWRAVACIFNLQPCQPQSHTSLICKKDCVDLMTECKSNTTTQSPDEICELLSPSHLQNDCISLNDYLC
jgi:reversion-inducing cysteine-rich kazal motif protein